jgi:chromosome partitioning protein
MKRVVYNQKGGVGKSSIAVNLAAIFAMQGRRTLLVDMDTQCNASRYLLGDAAKTVKPTLADFFKSSLEFQFRPLPASGYPQPTPFENLFLLASDPDLSELQGKLQDRYKIFKLRDGLNELSSEFDEIIIDTPPAYNFFTKSALIASDRVLIPFDCDDFSREALYTLRHNVEETRLDHNGALSIEGIVVNQFQKSAKLPQQMVDELVAEGLPVLNSKLSSSVKIRESHSSNKPMIYLYPNHKLTKEFQALYEELQAS